MCDKVVKRPESHIGLPEPVENGSRGCHVNRADAPANTERSGQTPRRTDALHRREVRKSALIRRGEAQQDPVLFGFLGVRTTWEADHRGRLPEATAWPSSQAVVAGSPKAPKAARCSDACRESFCRLCRKETLRSTQTGPDGILRGGDCAGR